MLVHFFLVGDITSAVETKLINQKFVGGKINARLLSPLKEGTTILVGIPGGPQISGRYLDSITMEIAQENKFNAMVIDLPNHGESTRLGPEAQKIQYSEVRTMLLDLLGELALKRVKVILLGHSFGALIAADLLRAKTIPIEFSILIGLPAVLKRTEAFSKHLQNVGALKNPTNEAEFKSWWARVLPAYFFHQPTLEALKILTSETFYSGNEDFAVGLPSFEAMAQELRETAALDNMIYIEGEKEMVLPKNNLELVKNALPNIPLTILKGVGHFPMLEDAMSLKRVVTEALNSCTRLVTYSSN